MLTRYQSLLLLFAIFSTAMLPMASRADPVDLSPPRNPLGAADENGTLRYVHRFGDIFFSDNFSIPLRFDFSSRRAVEGTRSDFGWHGWRCGAIESAAHFTEEKRILRVDLLCAKVMYLQRTDEDPNRYLTTDGAWVGVVDGDTISVSREDGWLLRFVSGKVDYFRTDKGREIRWHRDAEGRLMRIQEDGTESPQLALVWKEGRVSEISVERNLFRIGYRDDTLSSIAWTLPGGIEREFLCEQKENSISLGASHFGRYYFSWMPENGIVLNDGVNTYSLRTRKLAGSDKEIQFLNLHAPDKSVTSYEIGNRFGEVRQTTPGGQEIVTTRVVSEGRDNGAVSRSEWIREGQPSRILLANTFDEKGHIIQRLHHGNPAQLKAYAGGVIDPALLPNRDFEYPAAELDEDSEMFMLEYTYTEDDQILTISVNREPLILYTYDDQSRLVSVDIRNRYRKNFAFLDDGGVRYDLVIAIQDTSPFWYLESDDPTIGPDLVTSSLRDVDNRLLEQTHADGRKLRVEYDAQMRRVRDITMARDGETQIESISYVHSPANDTALRINEDLLTGSIKYSDISVYAIGLEVKGRPLPKELYESKLLENTER